MPKSDAELVTETLAGNSQAFEDLVSRYQRLVFNIVYHYLGRRSEVEDVAQEVFLKVYRALSRYDLTRPFKAWISRITVNSCLDQLRKSRNQRVSLFSDLGEEDEHNLERLYSKHGGDAGLTQNDARRLLDTLQEQVAQLNHKDRTAFVLRELEGEEYAEIAAVMETSELAVRIRVSRVRKKLLEGFKQQGVGRN